MQFATMKRVVLGCLCAGTLGAAACADGGGVPTGPSAERQTGPSTSVAGPPLAASSPRSGDFKLTKACPTFTGQANDHCTVTTSDLRAIGIGTRFVYVDAVDANGLLNSDITLEPPGPGNNRAFGHCIFPPGKLDNARSRAGLGSLPTSAGAPW